MRTVAEIDKEIQDLEEKLEHIKGQPTEVYSRIVGYYRSLRNWNLGKREEYSHRIVFDTPAASVVELKEGPAAGNAPAAPDEADVREYIYFFRETCPNCPPVRIMLSRIGIPGIEMDADTEEGTRAALEYGIYTTPTVVFLSANGDEVYRASSVAQLSNLEIPQTA